MQTTNTLQVANTIRQQLGGNRFAAMTGAKNFMGSPDSLTFALPANFAKDGINRVRIVLVGDLYAVEFFKIRGTKVQLISEACAVYADQLAALFTSRTGLNTSL